MTRSELKSGMSNAVDSHPICSSCGYHIDDKYFLQALDTLWHDRCLRCDCCNAPLAELSPSFYVKYGRKFCSNDYMRANMSTYRKKNDSSEYLARAFYLLDSEAQQLFGPTSKCTSCTKIILACDQVIKVSNDVMFHLHCFKCSSCSRRFCVGDQFHFDGETKQTLCTKMCSTISPNSASGTGPCNGDSSQETGCSI